MLTTEQIHEALIEGGMYNAGASKWAPRIMATLADHLLLADEGYRDTHSLDALRYGVNEVEVAPIPEDQK